MNPLLVILHADKARGGAERYTLDLAEALAAQGHRVRLGARTFVDLPSGVEAVDLDGGGMTRTGQYRRFLDRLDAHLLANSYDIVHAMLPVRRCDLYHPHAGIAAETMRQGSLFTRCRNHLNARRRAFASVEGQLLQGDAPPVTLCLSQVIRRTVLRHYSLPEDRLAMLFNAVDLERFNPAAIGDDGAELRQRYGIPPEAPLAAMIAQDFERKGLAETLAAMRNLTSLRLIVAGRPKPARWQRLAEAMGISNRVVFTGPLADPRPVYAGADFLVLPTRHDPCSLVVLEALAMGLPVITTARNGASEIMVDGVHGYVLENPEDIESLAKAMARLIDPSIRARMRQACQTLRPSLAYETHLKHLLAIYSADSTA